MSMRENEKQTGEKVQGEEKIQKGEKMQERDRMHFEFLMLEIMQCGLNWQMILRRREVIRACFDQFDYYKVAGYDAARTETILKTDGMIRNKKKVQAIIANAGSFIKIIEEFGSFESYLRKFLENHVMEESVSGENVLAVNHNNPFRNELSDGLSRDLKRRGLQYVGTITVYSYLQACGILVDREWSSYLI